MPDDTAPTTFVHPDDIRADFCAALSRMYREEVPLYGALVELVDDVNEDVRSRGGSWEVADRLDVERHGAIRLGKPSELAFIARLFRVMNMHPVGYYDLSPSRVPVHATAFRSLSSSGLAKNPFRVFCSLLRPELLPPPVRTLAMNILEKRDIFHPLVRSLVALAEEQGGLEAAQARKLVKFAMDTFRWHETALVDCPTYEMLKETHPLVADIAGFQGPHINHLTPRVLDIDAAQRGMLRKGIPPKEIIEGPPRRLCPILLRQTSFQALSEPIKFPGGQTTDGSHRARFGEIESRGAALTRKGYALYLALQERYAAKGATVGDNETHQTRLAEIFADFPDTWTALRRDNLAYFTYSLAVPCVTPRRDRTLEELVDNGVVLVSPVVYEDFLPASAAGIFQSNLGTDGRIGLAVAGPDQPGFEVALGRTVEDPFEIYGRIQEESVREVVRLTGCRRT